MKTYVKTINVKKKCEEKYCNMFFFNFTLTNAGWKRRTCSWWMLIQFCLLCVRSVLLRHIMMQRQKLAGRRWDFYLQVHAHKGRCDQERSLLLIRIDWFGNIIHVNKLFFVARTTEEPVQTGINSSKQRCVICRWFSATAMATFALNSWLLPLISNFDVAWCAVLVAVFFLPALFGSCSWCPLVWTRVECVQFNSKKEALKL